MGQVGKLGQARGIGAHCGGEQNQGSRGRGKGIWGGKQAWGDSGVMGLTWFQGCHGWA